MAVMELAEIIKTLKPGSRLMGLDLGSKTVGLALSDVTRIIASPLETIKRSKFTADAQMLESLIDAHNVGGLILGLPVSMDGSEGPRCQSTRQFATNLLARRDIALSFWDERLSTAAVERVLIGQADMTRKRRAEVVDKAAAAYILQGALDAIARTPGQ
ncbi:MAG: Holliday junction resolvase RuvX [Rhodospirillaceae bacterium]|nr:Holliday junction resolvase RuvX [Rhodospirillaceae bacterium]MBL6941162.1 Holliday junction resolvase RuvX [Rhodospirillales bacterium]